MSLKKICLETIDNNTENFTKEYPGLPTLPLYILVQANNPELVAYFLNKKNSLNPLSPDDWISGALTWSGVVYLTVFNFVKSAATLNILLNNKAITNLLIDDIKMSKEFKKLFNVIIKHGDNESYTIFFHHLTEQKKTLFTRGYSSLTTMGFDALPHVLSQINEPECARKVLSQAIKDYINSREANPEQYFHGKFISTLFGGISKLDKLNAARNILECLEQNDPSLLNESFSNAREQGELKKLYSSFVNFYDKQKPEIKPINMQ